MYIINKYYVRIKVCCASCAHKTIDREGERTCDIAQLPVLPYKKCKNWELCKGLTKAGLISLESPGLRDKTEQIQAFRKECEQREKLERELACEKMRKRRYASHTQISLKV